jgi:hypothetical protein
MMAARAAFVVLWLENINWHSEAHALSDRTRATPRLKNAFEKLEGDVIRTGELQDAAALFSWIFGYGLKTEEWRATSGAPLVEELWGIINTLSWIATDGIINQRITTIMKTYTITIPAYQSVIEAKSEKEALAQFWDNYDDAVNEYGFCDNPIIKVTGKQHGR